MDNKRLEDKIDRIAEDIAIIKVTMAVNTASLETHIKRTEIAEQRLDDQELKFEPLESHVSFMKGVAWSLGIVGAMLLGLQQMGILAKLF